MEDKTNLDAEPAARAKSCEVNLPQAASELGNPVRQLTQDGTGNTPKIEITSEQAALFHRRLMAIGGVTGRIWHE